MAEFLKRLGIAILAIFLLAAPAAAHSRTASHHHRGHPAHHAVVHHVRRHRGTHRQHSRHPLASPATRAVANCTVDNVKRLKLTRAQTRHLSVGTSLEILLSSETFHHSLVKGDTVWSSCRTDIGQLAALRNTKADALQTQIEGLKKQLGTAKQKLGDAQKANTQLKAVISSQHASMMGLWAVFGLLAILAVLLVGLMFVRSRNLKAGKKHSDDHLRTRTQELNASNSAKAKAERELNEARRDSARLEDLLDQAVEGLRSGHPESREDLADRLARRERTVKPVSVGDEDGPFFTDDPS